MGDASEWRTRCKFVDEAKLGLIEQAIDYSVETGDFEHAFGLA